MQLVHHGVMLLLLAGLRVFKKLRLNSHIADGLSKILAGRHRGLLCPRRRMLHFKVVMRLLSYFTGPSEISAIIRSSTVGFSSCVLAALMLKLQSRGGYSSVG